MSRGQKLIVTSGALIVVLTFLTGLGVWYLLIRDDSPPPVSLEAAVEQVGSLNATATVAEESATETAASTATAEATSEPTVAATDAAAPDAAGSSTVAAEAAVVEWAVSSDDGSFVGYRIDEELASIGATTAVGRTSEVTGTVSMQGTTVTAATFEANLQALASDESRRDNALRNQALETDVYPTATFVLSEPIELGEPLADGAILSVVARGELTVHGVTQIVELPLEAQYTGGVLVVVGSLDISLEDYGIDQPSAPAVVSVSDTATLELQLMLAST
jgi:polyisoprenoid-binding protein YceI